MPFIEADDQPDDQLYHAVQSDLYDGNGEPIAEDDEELEAAVAGASALAAVGDLDEEIENEQEEDGNGPAPVADMGEDLEAPALSQKRAAVAKTPRSAKKSATPSTSGRKRKAADADIEENTPAKSTKRGRPTRVAATSARLSVREASKGKRGRPKAAVSTASKPAKGKAGRPKKSNVDNGAVPENEWEVEKIIESAIDADSLEHMYQVKWKGYPNSQNTWEPKSHLSHAMDLVRKFDASKKGKLTKQPQAPAEKKERKKPGRKPKPKA